MAAVTEATDSRRDFVIGDRRAITVKLTAPADGDTWATGLYKIDTVQITPIGTTQSASDQFAVGSISDGTITFKIVGTARDLLVYVVGK